MAGEPFELPDMSELAFEDKIEVCWNYITRNYPGQEGPAVLAFFDGAWNSENPDAWAVASEIKQRAKRKGYL